MESKLKIVLDTNILISSLVHDGVARKFVYSLLKKEFKIVLSNYILAETEEVLTRNKFKDKELLNDLWEKVKEGSQMVKVDFKVSQTPLRDPKDHPILLTAKISKAKFIITGDDDLLVLKEWKKVKILTMNQFTSQILSS